MKPRVMCARCAQDRGGLQPVYTGVAVDQRHGGDSRAIARCVCSPSLLLWASSHLAPLCVALGMMVTTDVSEIVNFGYFPCVGVASGARCGVARRAHGVQCCRLSRRSYNRPYNPAVFAASGGSAMVRGAGAVSRFRGCRAVPCIVGDRPAFVCR
jgi:hypothetical protein